MSSDIESLRAILREVAPRKAFVELISAHADLGFDGEGLDILEYLTLLDRAARTVNPHVVFDPWPRTLSELLTLLSGGA